MLIRFRSSRRAGAALAVALLAFVTGPATAALELWSDGFEDNNTAGWTITNHGATIALDATNGNSGTHALQVTGNAGANQGAFACSRQIFLDFTRDYTVQCAFRYRDFHWDQFLIFGHVRLLLDYPDLPILFDPVGNCSYVGNPVSASSFRSYLPAQTWGWITVHCRPRQRQYSVFVDGTHVGTVTYQASVQPASQLFFEDNHSATNFLDASYDDVSVRGFQAPQGFAHPFVPTDVENNPAHWAMPPPVPYHAQYTQLGNPLSEPFCPPGPNGRCAVACLQMIFERYGDVLPGVCPGPQEEIEAAVNTNDRDSWPNGSWAGTTATDIRRGGHFSNASQAATGLRNGNPPAGQPPGPANWGYSWRDLGYSVVDSVWSDLAPTDTVDTLAQIVPDVLETFLGSGYPIMIGIDPPDDYLDWARPDSADGQSTAAAPPEDTAIGHAILLVGYDNLGTCPFNPWRLSPHPGLRPAFLLHDPNFQKYVWYPQAKIWQWWERKRFWFVSPWEQTWLMRKVWPCGAKLDGSLLVTYAGAPPLDGLYPVGNAQAMVTLNNLGFQGAEVARHGLWAPGGTARTGDWDFTTWKLQVGGWVPGGPNTASATYSAWGRLNPAVSSSSYAGYADDLGARATVSNGLTLQLIPGPRPGHWGHPYSDDWWCEGGDDGEGGGESGLKLRPLGGTTQAVYAKVVNWGSDPVPAGTVCRLFYTEPTVAERAGLGTYIGQLVVPPLAWGDTLTLGPLSWTAPPLNGLGEPHFSLLSTIDCPADPPASDWPQDEDNHATLSDFSFSTPAGAPVSMRFRVENPESSPREVVLQVTKEGEAAPWSASLSLPAGVPIPLAPMQSLICEVAVTPAGPGTSGLVDVEAFLFRPDGELVRETGGVTLRILVEGPSDASSREESVPFALEPNAPNPFAATTAIRFALPRAGRITLRVYDVRGREVRTLVDERRAAGWYRETWSGCDDGGRRVANGVYFCRLDLDGRWQTARRMVLLE